MRDKERERRKRERVCAGRQIPSETHRARQEIIQQQPRSVVADIGSGGSIERVRERAFEASREGEHQYPSAVSSPSKPGEPVCLVWSPCALERQLVRQGDMRLDWDDQDQ